MTNIYNKGKYRSGEWAKHLRPYLKRQGNKRWRRTKQDLLKVESEFLEVTPSTRERKLATKKSVEVVFKIRLLKDQTSSYKARYFSLRSARDAMNRNKVIEAKIVK